MFDIFCDSLSYNHGTLSLISPSFQFQLMLDLNFLDFSLLSHSTYFFIFIFLIYFHPLI